MESAAFHLTGHRAKFAFYYERAHSLEIAAADLVGHLRGPLTTLLNAQSNGKRLPAALPELLVTHIEAAFTVAVTAVRTGPTFSRLTPAEREQFETELFLIHFGA